MRCLKFAAVLAVLLVSVAQLQAQQQETETPPANASVSTSTSAKPEKTGKEETTKEQPETPPVVTQHEIHVHGKVLKYTATTGMLPIKNDEGKIEANMFFVAYTLDNPPNPGRRPLMFSFNGGPGSSSVWLHLGAIGPKRVKLLPNGEMPSPPFRLEDNQDTWLDQTDLVFIDPVGTGFSRPVRKELGKKFWDMKGDVESVGQFILLYLTRYERWDSPLFLVGESYGTTRAAGLSDYLIRHGVALNGIVLVSSVLNFQTLEFTRGNDLPYVLYLPSYTTTAWFHKKLPSDLQSQDLKKTIEEVEQWAGTDYAQALQKGDQLTPAERQDIIDHLARYTGLNKSYIDDADLRIPQANFCKELLRDRKRTVGRLDSRFEGIDTSGISGTPEYDPSEAAVRPPFTTVFNNYVRKELGYKTDLHYYILGNLYQHWGWGSASKGFPNVSPALRDAMTKNRYMKLFVGCGYFDLATPFFASNYTLNHLGLDPSLRSNITIRYYDSGHMVYINDASLAKLKLDISSFLQDALK
jgi:carboxypeptidase C (cathepsin A)